MRLMSQRAFALMTVFIALSFASGCGSNPSGPLDPALSGQWTLPSVDTYSKFVLQQRGTVVTGTFGDYTANQSFSEEFIVSGTANLPHVVLSWVQRGTRETFDATLSADQTSLTGIIEPGANAATFLRDRPIFVRRMAAQR